ncbi:MAG: hypothetical protein EBT03_07965 [Betaproteobacteria bacterium]|nr:hypothetical protein [Betaproteobacteria bacterium]NCA17031.1 hypothetical protein [Betaproteobacteria bacterium]
MPTGITDINSTLLEAERDGVTRRAVQLRRQKQREAAGEEQPPAAANYRPGGTARRVPIMPLSQPVKPERLRPIEAAARAGALERALHRRLQEALERGDLAAVKLLSASWKEVLTGLNKLEEAAEREECHRRTIKRNREMGIAI